MICEQALELLSARLDGALDPEAAEALEAHLAACPDCQRLADSLRGLDEQLAGLREPAPAGLKKGVLYRIDQASGKAKKPKIRWLGPGTALGAVAAVLVLLVGLKVIPLGQKTYAGDAARDNHPAETMVPETAAPAARYDGTQIAGYPASLDDGANWQSFYNYDYEYSAAGTELAESAIPMEPEPAKAPDSELSGGSLNGEDGAESPQPVTEEVRETCAALSAEEDAMVLLYTEFDPKSLFSLLESEEPELYALTDALELEERDGLLVCETDCGTALAIHEWLVAQLPKSVIMDADTVEAEASLNSRLEELDPGSGSLYKVVTWTASRHAVLWPEEWPEGWADRVRTEENWEMFFPEEEYTPNSDKTAYLAFVP